MWFGKGSATHVQHTLTCLILSVGMLPFRYQLVSKISREGSSQAGQADFNIKLSFKILRK